MYVGGFLWEFSSLTTLRFQMKVTTVDTHKTTNAWKMVLILVIELQVWVSIKGYGYLAFCLKKIRNNPIFRPFSSRYVSCACHHSLLEPQKHATHEYFFGAYGA